MACGGMLVFAAGAAQAVRGKLATMNVRPSPHPRGAVGGGRCTTVDLGGLTNHLTRRRILSSHEPATAKPHLEGSCWLVACRLCSRCCTPALLALGVRCTLASRLQGPGFRVQLHARPRGQSLTELRA